jgi:hypothetical protein
MSENVRTSTFRNPKGLHGLYRKLYLAGMKLLSQARDEQDEMHWHRALSVHEHVDNK